MSDARRVLRGTRLADGRLVDLLIEHGRIAAVERPGTVPGAYADETDADGRLALPALAEPHIHLDKALTIDHAGNRTGDLAGAIESWLAHRVHLTGDDVYVRAREALRVASHHGVTALRTHVDTGVGAPLEAVEALVRLREELRGIVELQIVAGHGLPVTGTDGAANTRILHRALELGADAVGGAPSLDADPVAAWRVLVDVARNHGVPLDLHVDETLDPGIFLLEHIAREAANVGVPVTVGHVVSLAVQPESTRRDTARALADAGVAVVTLPQTNLFLQGRHASPVAPRGLTALDELAEAGVLVAAGADNVGDPFNPAGRIDPLETASLLVTAGHRDVATALDAVSVRARTLLGLPRAALQPGDAADFLLIRSTSPTDAIGRASVERETWRAGHPVATTRSIRTWSPDA